jgi:hypothetical protein
MHNVKLQYSCPLISTAEHGVNAIVELLSHADVGDVADVSEVHSASIFMVRACWETTLAGLGTGVHTHVQKKKKHTHKHTHRNSQTLRIVYHDNESSKLILPKCLHHCQHPHGVTTKELT